MTTPLELALEASGVAYSRIVAQAIPPAVLLAAVGTSLSMLMGRLWRILDQLRAVEAGPSPRADRASLLIRRVKLLYKAIYAMVGVGVAVATLVLAIFVNALMSSTREWGVALLFAIAITLFATALMLLGLEVRLAIKEFDQHASAARRYE